MTQAAAATPQTVTTPRTILTIGLTMMYFLALLHLGRKAAQETDINRGA
jgi:hypothetical protein